GGLRSGLKLLVFVVAPGSLPAGPPTTAPQDCGIHRPLQEDDINREKQQTQRQHPDAKHWQEAEYAAEDENDAKRNAHPAGFRPAHTSEPTGGKVGYATLQPFKEAI